MHSNNNNGNCSRHAGRQPQRNALQVMKQRAWGSPLSNADPDTEAAPLSANFGRRCAGWCCWPRCHPIWRRRPSAITCNNYNPRVRRGTHGRSAPDRTDGRPITRSSCCT